MTNAPPAAADHAGVRFPPPFIYLSGLLLGWALESIAPTADWPRPVRIAVAVVLALLSVALLGAAERLFRRHHTAVEPWKPSSTLLTDGPYRFTRNPIYVGMALLYAAIAIGFGLLWAFALLLVVLLVIDRYVIAREERYLLRRFGEAYREYTERVRRWL